MQRRKTLARWCLLLVFLSLLPFCLSYPKDISDNLLKEKNDAQVTVLNYHKVDDTKIALSISPADFEQQMLYLQENGYTAISPDELLANLKEGIPLPEKPVLITFDDGYEDNYKNAFPILQKFGYKATIFVITDFLSCNPNYLTWDQAREMQASGITIASHTMQHKSLTALSDEEIRAELCGSKAALEYQLKIKNAYFAYPTGTYNAHIMKLVEETGYKGAFTIKYGNVDAASCPFALERVPVFRTDKTFASFKRRIENIPLFERIGWIKS